MSRHIINKKAKPQLGLRNLTLNDQIAKVTGIEAIAKGSTIYKGSKTLQNSLTTLISSASDLSDQVKLVTATHQAYESARADLEKTRESFQRNGTAYLNDVDNAANGDADKIKELGLTVKGSKGARDPNAPLEPPTAITATPGKHAGEVSLHFKRPVGARTFNIQTSTTDSGPWTGAPSSTRSRTVIGGLPAGQKVWVRIASVGVKGQSGWSTPISTGVQSG